MITKDRSDVLNQSNWAFKLARLVKLATKQIAQAEQQDNVSPLIRFVEIFTSPQNFNEESILKIYDYIIRHGFFKHLRQICDTRIPPMIAETSKAPVPIAGTILDLIMQPLRLIQEDNNDFANKVLTSLTEHFLTEKFSEQIDFFIVPSLASEKSFPYATWSKVLHGNSKLKKSPWLLYAFLRLGKIHSFDVQCYLNVLSDLTGTILHMSGQAVTSISPNDADDDSDHEETTKDAMDTNEDDDVEIIVKSVAMINDDQVVASLVNATEKAQNEPLALTALCKLCHNLLLSDPLALQHFKLLYTLAFRPALLHTLWNLILDTKRPSVVGSSIPLLTVRI